MVNGKSWDAQPIQVDNKDFVSIINILASSTTGHSKVSSIFIFIKINTQVVF